MTEDKHTAENLMSVVGEGETLPDDELLYDLADLFKTFGDTTRIKMLYALMNGDLYVNDIAEIVGVSQSAVLSPAPRAQASAPSQIHARWQERHVFVGR